MCTTLTRRVYDGHDHIGTGHQSLGKAWQVQVHSTWLSRVDNCNSGRLRLCLPTLSLQSKAVSKSGTRTHCCLQIGLLRLSIMGERRISTELNN